MPIQKAAIQASDLKLSLLCLTNEIICLWNMSRSFLSPHLSITLVEVNFGFKTFVARMCISV